MRFYPLMCIHNCSSIIKTFYPWIGLYVIVFEIKALIIDRQCSYIFISWSYATGTYKMDQSRALKHGVKIGAHYALAKFKLILNNITTNRLNPISPLCISGPVAYTIHCTSFIQNSRFFLVWWSCYSSVFCSWCLRWPVKIFILYVYSYSPIQPIVVWQTLYALLITFLSAKLIFSAWI